MTPSPEDMARDFATRADRYRDAQVPVADIQHPFPMWYGWAIYKAWGAGYEAAKADEATRLQGEKAIAARLNALGDAPDIMIGPGY